MVRPGVCRKVVALFRQSVISQRTYSHSPSGVYDTVPGCRVPASAPCSPLRPESTGAAVRLALSASSTAATAAFRRKVWAAAGALGGRVVARKASCNASSTAASPAAAGAEHPVVVSHSCRNLSGILSHNQRKTGNAVCFSFRLAPLLFPLCFSPLFSTSTAGASLIRSPLLPLARISSFIDATTHSTPPATVYYKAALPYDREAAHQKSAPATHGEASEEVPVAIASRRPAVNYRSSSDTSGCRNFPGDRNSSRACFTSGSTRRLATSTNWYPGEQSAFSRPPPLFSPYFSIPHSSLPGRSWRGAARRTPPHATGTAAARAPSSIPAARTATTEIPTTKATSLLNRRRGTMATMGGFNPKDPHQAADVVLVPFLSDNYAYLLIDRETKKAACVDPAEPQKVLHTAAKEGVELSLCLCTHKHYDHAGGNVELAQKVPGIEIAGSAYEETPGVNKHLRNKDTVNLGDLRIEALHAPCHTSGHLLYFVTNARHPTLAPILFSGDTLFIGGCGRFFEGSAQQMHHALIDICGALPSNTRVYCGHEYTKANLEFALTIEPDNEDLQAKYTWTKQQRSSGLPTIPSTLAQEKCYNPFMRTETNSVQSAVGALGDPIETMRLLREKKNAFK